MGTEREALLDKIKELKEKRNACILAHNFQSYEVQKAADFVGGTKEIYSESIRREEEVILVASVHPMAQVVACLSSEKTVLSPDTDAGCPMMGMLDLERVRDIKKNRPEIEIVSHVKASPGAIAISRRCLSYPEALESLGEKEDNVLFIPDMYIAKNISLRLGREISSIGGYCPPHVKILPRDLEEKRERHPDAVVLAHPECRSEVTAPAHAVLESGDMVRYVRESDTRSFIVASEVSLVERLARENPDKNIIPASSKALCQSMKHITLEKIYWSLDDMTYSVEADAKYAVKIRDSLRKLYKGWKPMA